MSWLAKLRRALFPSEHQRLSVVTLAALGENERGRVHGAVEATEPLLIAPLSQRSCVYWAVIIEAVQADVIGTVIPDVFVAREMLGELATWSNFAIADPTGRALVETRHVQTVPSYSHTEKSLAAFDASPAQRELLALCNAVDRDWFNTAAVRYREAVIQPGDRIELIGSGIREPDLAAAAGAQGAYREEAPTRLRFSGSAARPLFLRGLS